MTAREAAWVLIVLSMPQKSEETNWGAVDAYVFSRDIFVMCGLGP